MSGTGAAAPHALPPARPCWRAADAALAHVPPPAAVPCSWERSCTASDAWAGRHLRGVQIDMWGRFKYCVLRVRCAQQVLRVDAAIDHCEPQSRLAHPTMPLPLPRAATALGTRASSCEAAMGSRPCSCWRRPAWRQPRQAGRARCPPRRWRLWAQASWSGECVTGLAGMVACLWHSCRVAAHLERARA